MLPGETIATGAPPICQDCHTHLTMEVLRTCAYYIGTQCSCGPYSRESDYYPTFEAAEAALTSGTFRRS